MSAFESKNRTFRHRNEIDVSLRMMSADKPVNATVFASLGERASDLLNDSRAFIPVRLHSGETMIIAKSQIAAITESIENDDEEQKSRIHGEDFSSDADAPEKPAASFDAYAMLKVAPDAGADEIRAAYKARIKAVHPDTMASLGLDEEIAKAALLATQKVNYAYQKIMRERGAKTDRVV